MRGRIGTRTPLPTSFREGSRDQPASAPQRPRPCGGERPSFPEENETPNLHRSEAAFSLANAEPSSAPFTFSLSVFSSPRGHPTPTIADGTAGLPSPPRPHAPCAPRSGGRHATVDRGRDARGRRSKMRPIARSGRGEGCAREGPAPFWSFPRLGAGAPAPQPAIRNHSLPSSVNRGLTTRTDTPPARVIPVPDTTAASR